MGFGLSGYECTDETHGPNAARWKVLEAFERTLGPDHAATARFAAALEALLQDAGPRRAIDTWILFNHLLLQTDFPNFSFRIGSHSAVEAKFGSASTRGGGAGEAELSALLRAQGRALFEQLASSRQRRPRAGSVASAGSSDPGDERVRAFPKLATRPNSTSSVVNIVL